MGGLRPLAAVLLGAMIAASAPVVAGQDKWQVQRSVPMSQSQLYDALLDALYATFGNHPGFRIAHARGVLVNGTFVASKAAQGLSRAAHLQGNIVPILVRFSNFSGVPSTRDGDPDASPHGMAIRFELPGGLSTDIVAHSYDGFPVATPEAFLVFLQGIAASVATPANPAPLQAFLADHPRVQAFLEAAKPAPRSYSSSEYFGVNSLVFVDAQGGRHVGRYRIEPQLKEPPLGSAQLAAMPDDYLQRAMAGRLAVGPVNLRLMLQLAEPGDAIGDGSIPWPRQGAQAHAEVELGILTLRALVPSSQQATAQQTVAFDPGGLVDGIETSTDPMIAARHEIYRRAALRRRQPGS